MPRATILVEGFLIPISVHLGPCQDPVTSFENLSDPYIFSLLRKVDAEFESLALTLLHSRPYNYSYIR